LPDNVKVLASNVTIINSSNELTSSDLQTALDKEIAVNVTKAIVGVWDVHNYSGVTAGCGVNPTGRVEFRSDGTYAMLAGSLSAGREYADGTEGSLPPYRCMGHQEQRYQLVHGGILFQSKLPSQEGNYLLPVAAVGSISAKNQDAITIFGSEAISHLTRVGAPTTPGKQAEQPVSAKPQSRVQRTVVATAVQD
jgi:hypothetical protein